MRGMTVNEAQVPGSIPGGGYKSTTGNHEGSSESVQCCSVEIAKMVSLQGGNAPCTENHLLPAVGDVIESPTVDGVQCCSVEIAKVLSVQRVGQGAKESCFTGVSDNERGQGQPGELPKCAAVGCMNRQAEEGVFCVACIASGKAKPSTTCDNLPVVSEEGLARLPGENETEADWLARMENEGGAAVLPGEQVQCDVHGVRYAGEAACECSCTDDDDFGRRVDDGCPQHGAIPEEEEQPNDKQPPSPVVRTCKGKYGTGPEDACDAILGPEVVGDYCSHCLSFEQKRTDVFANPDNLAEQAMRAAYEYAWQKLADDPRLDPVTVAHCKHLRDLEVRS
jgi:hypothetical protein